MSIDRDRHLLRAWRSGDQAAGSELVNRHFNSVYRFFRRKLADAELAKDLTQKTFLSCLESRDRIRDDTRFRAFLLGIARNMLLRQFRTDGRAAARAEQRENAPREPTLESPSRVAAMRQEQRLLLRALRELPLDLQMTIELHYWEELTTAEIAHVLEVAQGTVKWRLSRARELLREAIERLSDDELITRSTVGALDDWARSLRDTDAEPDTESTP